MAFLAGPHARVIELPLPQSRALRPFGAQRSRLPGRHALCPSLVQIRVHAETEEMIPEMEGKVRTAVRDLKKLLVSCLAVDVRAFRGSRAPVCTQSPLCAARAVLCVSDHRLVISAPPVCPLWSRVEPSLSCCVASLLVLCSVHARTKRAKTKSLEVNSLPTQWHWWSLRPVASRTAHSHVWWR